jgi:hypothetical protein
MENFRSSHRNRMKRHQSISAILGGTTRQRAQVPVYKRRSRSHLYLMRDAPIGSALCLNRQYRTVIQQQRGFNFEPAGNASDVVYRDVAFGSFDPTEIRSIYSALMRQRFLAEFTCGPKAAHVPRQNVSKRSFVSLFHGADFGRITLLRRPLLSYIRRSHRRKPPRSWQERF